MDYSYVFYVLTYWDNYIAYLYVGLLAVNA